MNKFKHLAIEEAKKMGCDKRYGLREVWVAPEASPNTPATYTDDNYLQHCTGSNFPAVYRENLDNGEATGNRGQSQAFSGAQNELAWDVTVMLPNNAGITTPASLPESLQALFWAAGFGSQSGPSSWTPGGTGIIMGMTAGSACGRTIQLVGLDRDKRQFELLTGAVVSQVVFNFSRSDVCTMQFSGVAAQKWEAVAPVIAVADIGHTTFNGFHVRSSYNADLPYSPAVITGVSLTLPGASAELQSVLYSANGISLKSDLSSSTITSATQSYWSVAKPSSTYTVLSPEDWSVDGFGAVTSATFTVETGQGYGELTTSAKYPSELLSGQVKTTASVSAYLVDANVGQNIYDNGGFFYINFAPNLGGTSIAMESAKFTDVPAIGLDSVDDASTGDFNLAGGETGANSSLGFLDTVYFV